jgi:hypothetical protein
MPIEVFCAGGKIIPSEYVEKGEYEEKQAKIVGMNPEERTIVIAIDGPLTKKCIVLTGSTIKCQGREEPVWGPFLSRHEATVGSDIALLQGDEWIWKNPPEYIMENQKTGDILTLFEFSRG